MKSNDEGICKHTSVTYHGLQKVPDRKRYPLYDCNKCKTTIMDSIFTYQLTEWQINPETLIPLVEYLDPKDYIQVKGKFRQASKDVFKFAIFRTAVALQTKYGLGCR